MARRLKGTAAAPGIAIAPLVQFHMDLDFIPTRVIGAADVEKEATRLDEAILSASQSIQFVRQQMARDLSAQDAKIYDAQLALLHDSTFKADLVREIERGLINTEVALQRVVARYEQVFEQMQDAAMRERAADVRDVGRHLLATLLEKTRSVYISGGRDYLFAADEFLPTDAGLLDRQHIRGIVTVRGGKYSHGAILARSLGIPCVVAVDELLSKAPSGAVCVLDGETGTVVIEPSEEDLRHYQHQLAERQALERRLAEVKLLPSTMGDGTEVRLCANVESVRDMAQLELDTVAGIGLFRTEFAFMERHTFPTEEEQRRMYTAAVEQSQGKPVTFRTLDVGGEKPLRYFRTPEERNPQLGWRGIRIGLDWPDLFYTQVRAILRASAMGKARILVPMVSNLDEVRRCREALEMVIDDLRQSQVPHDPKIELGVMVEVPAIVHVLDMLLPLVDFVSVGTNDLVQYTLAVDRDNPRVASLYDPYHPAVLRMLAQVAAAARHAGKPASICGEIAGDHYFTAILLGLGFRELSMAPVALTRVKLMVRSWMVAECEELATQAMAMTDAATIRTFARERARARAQEFLQQTPAERARR